MADAQPVPAPVRVPVPPLNQEDKIIYMLAIAVCYLLTVSLMQTEKVTTLQETVATQSNQMLQGAEHVSMLIDAMIRLRGEIELLKWHASCYSAEADKRTLEWNSMLAEEYGIHPHPAAPEKKPHLTTEKKTEIIYPDVYAIPLPFVPPRDL